jgi:hypothetical protein
MTLASVVPLILLKRSPNDRCAGARIALNAERISFKRLPGPVGGAVL